MIERRYTYFEIEFEKVSLAFKNKEYSKAVDRTALLLLEVLKEILQDVEAKLDAVKVRELTGLAENIGGGLPRERFSLEQMAELFSQSPLLEYLKDAEDEQQALVLLLSTYDLVKVVRLIRFIQKEAGGREWDGQDELRYRFPVQHILFCLAGFLNYDNRLRLTTIEVLPNQEEISRIYEEFHAKRMEVMLLLGLDPSKDVAIGLKLFDLVKDKGLLFNQSDGSRNVSLKVATLINLLSQIHDGITKHVEKVEYLIGRYLLEYGPKDSEIAKRIAFGFDSSEVFDLKREREIAERILRVAGYDCGIRFGTEMYESIQRQRVSLTDTQKVDRWCEFDSDVGFGRFHNYLQFTRDNRKHIFEVEGYIGLSDNFLVVNQVGSQSPHLCSFMTGYIQGVLEKMFRTNFSVEHSLSECEQGNPVNNESIFQIRSIYGNGNDGHS